ncbi:MAG TPA: hypothetical protein VGL99_03655 [Chloroflexota bacterium]
MLVKTLGGLCLLVSLYYGRFFLERQEPTTLLQLVTLLSAAALLVLRSGSPAPQPTGDRSWQMWGVLVAALVLAVLVFVIMDRDSHSVSDTLNRIAPTYALLTALVLRLRADRGAPLNRLG